MKKILIVDDSKLNRTVIRAIIEDYAKEAGDEKFEISEAEDGQIAFDICKTKKCDMIFMDIMMPNMDGITATQKIKEIDKKVMVVAVSALDDEESKSKILLAGAEDYIVKPVNGDVFRKRFSHYLSLLNSRGEKKFSSETTNVINFNVYCRKLIFAVEKESALAEFWEYYLIESSKFSEEISDLVRIIYGIGVWQLKLKYKFQILVEESEDSVYFTMTNMKLLDGATIENIIKKNYPRAVYKIQDDKITFVLGKSIKQEAEATVGVAAPAVGIKAEPKPQAQAASQATIEQSAATDDDVFELKDSELMVYDFMDLEDLEELDTIAADLNSLMLLVGSSKLEIFEIKEICDYIEKFGKILRNYNETYDLSFALTTLSTDIMENAAVFIERSKDISSLCIAFNNDLLMWLRKVFREGAPSIDFLDKSIISNSSMISNFIKPQSAQSAENLDDIFDF